MYQQISGSAWQGILTQYWSPGGFPSPTLAFSSYTDTAHGAAPSLGSIAGLESAVKEAIAANQGNGWPQSPTASDQFVIFTAPGATSLNSGWCGIHGATTNGIVYAMVDWGGLNNCSMTVTAAHEYAEVVTDPYPNEFEKKPAWKRWYSEDSAAEISTICNFFGRGFLPGGAEIPKIWDNSTESCSLGHANPPQISPQFLTGDVTKVTGTEATLQGSVHPNRLDVDSTWFKWGPGCYCTQTTHYGWGWGQQNGSVQGAKLTGLTPGTTYKYQLVVEAKGTGTGITMFGEQREFTTVDVPAVTTASVEPQTQPGTPTVGGTVNPRGIPGEYWVQFTTEADYEKNLWTNATSQPVPAQNLAASSSPVEVSVTLSGLSPTTWYTYRLAAKNLAGTAFGNRKSLQTLQTTASTGAATHVGTTSARLNGIVNPKGFATSYKFEYGTPEQYYGGSKQSVPVSAEAVGSGVGNLELTQTAGGLKPNTNYVFRIVAENTAGAVVNGLDQTFKTVSCKGSEGTCAWSAQATPDIAHAEYSLAGVSCTSATSCVGVGTDSLAGKGDVEIWNGSQWTNGPQPGQSVAGVSCPSTTWCMTVGAGIDGTPRGWLLNLEGGGWISISTTPPTPSGGSSLMLRGVSCSSTTACTAVGSYYVASEGKFKPLVERWNGTSWSLQTAPNPPIGNAENMMLAVSCPTSTSCTTVGAANNAPFVESWNGTSWSVQSIPAPSPSVSSKLEGISCTAANACTAVGSYKEASGASNYKKPLAESWNGTSWSIKTTPSPGEAKGAVMLSGVSCSSASACTAVGRYAPIIGEEPAEQRTLVESWNGTSWTVQSSPNSTQKVNGLVGVSCTASSACTAVGSAQPGPTNNENQASLAERWNGSEWKIQATPEKSRSGYSFAEVSCASVSVCLAVGNESWPGETRGIVELWNGSQWTKQLNIGKLAADVSCPSTTWCMAVGVGLGDQPRSSLLVDEGGKWGVGAISPPIPSGGSYAILNSVSCSSTTACTAVGSYYVASEGKYKPLVERWNGTSWSLQTPPNPPSGSAQQGMLAVSCPTSTSCTAVGTANNAPFVESWNGTSWSVQSIPAPSPSVEGTLEGVSCVAANVCTAVGSYKEASGAGNYKKPLAESRNGSVWTILPVPSPAGAERNVTLKAVSCTAGCTAVGQHTLPAAEGKPWEMRTLVEYWDGAKWAVQASPDSSLGVESYSGVSCSSAITCTAVGGGLPSSNLAGVEASLAARYE